MPPDETPTQDAREGCPLHPSPVKSRPCSGERAAAIVRETVETMLASAASMEEIGDEVVRRLASAAAFPSLPDSGERMSAAELEAMDDPFARADKGWDDAVAHVRAWLDDHERFASSSPPSDGEDDDARTVTLPPALVKLVRERIVHALVRSSPPVLDVPWADQPPEARADYETAADCVIDEIHELLAAPAPAGGEGDDERFARDDDPNYCPRCGSAFDERIGAGCNYCEHAPPVSSGGEGRADDAPGVDELQYPVSLSTDPAELRRENAGLRARLRERDAECQRWAERWATKELGADPALPLSDRKDGPPAWEGRDAPAREDWQEHLRIVGRGAGFDEPVAVAGHIDQARSMVAGFEGSSSPKKPFVVQRCWRTEWVDVPVRGETDA